MMFVIVISFFIYLTSTTEPMKSRIRGATQGALIAIVCAYPTWLYIGRDRLEGLVFITVIFCITGQFMIEPIQKWIAKYSKTVLDRLESILDRIFGGK